MKINIRVMSRVSQLRLSGWRFPQQLWIRCTVHDQQGTLLLMEVYTESSTLKTTGIGSKLYEKHAFHLIYKHIIYVDVVGIPIFFSISIKSILRISKLVMET